MSRAARGTAAAWLLAAACLLLGSMGLVLGPAGGSLPWHTLAAFAGVAALGELLPLPLPRSLGRAVPSSLAVVGTVALLTADPVLTLVVGACGAVLAFAVALTRLRERPTASDLLVSAAAAWALGGAASVGAVLPMPSIAPAAAPDGVLHTGTVLAVLAVVVVLAPAWELVADERLGHRASYRTRITTDAAVACALASAAALGALVFPALGVVALALVVLPLLATRLGLQRYEQVRTQHDQMVRAMSRLPEELGSVASGHGERVATVAVAAARSLGLDDGDVAVVRQAAHLHELGRIHGEPGALLDDSLVGLAGASILREADMDVVADVVAALDADQGGAGQAEVVVDASASRAVMLARLVRHACVEDRQTGPVATPA